MKKFGKHYFVKEPKAETDNITVDDCKNVIDWIYKFGYEPTVDLDEHRIEQIGKYKNVPYLLDTRAAVPQPDNFSKFIYEFCSIARRVCIANHIDPLNFAIKHVDEPPRKNLGFYEGIMQAFEVLNTNVKYGQMNKIQVYGLKYYVIVESIIQKIRGIFNKK